MTATTAVEKDTVLKLFKDFTVEYNPSSIAKELKRTRAGTFKALNFLEKDVIVEGKNFGKARFYWINLEDEYARKNVEILLMEEAKEYQRWKDEFKELFNYVDIVILFGSIIKNENKAKDIDLLLIFNEKNNSQVNRIIKSKNEVLLKKIHPMKQTREDLKENIKKRDRILINAIKEGIVLHGYEEFVELIKDVKS